METLSAVIPPERGEVTAVLPREWYLFCGLLIFLQSDLSNVGITINEYALLPLENDEQKQ